MQIKADTARKANGWVSVLVFPNGGRQVFLSYYGTMDEAQRNAQHMARLRDTHGPGACVADPEPHQCLEY